MDDFQRSLEELKSYRMAGGTAIVDAQPGGFGRDAESLRKLSEKSSVKILAVTGFHKLLFAEQPARWEHLDEGEIAGGFSREILYGMEDSKGHPTTIRAGLVKAALEEGGFEHPVYRKLLAAVARTAADTGAPVMIHTEKNTDMFQLLQFFEGYQVPADQLMICHLDRTHYDPDYHREVLKTGCMLCYDSVNRRKYISNEQEITLIKTMCACGHEDQLVLSLDTTNQRLRSYYAKDMGLDYILREFIPMLRAEGITERQIAKMCRQNAGKFLTLES